MFQRKIAMHTYLEKEHQPIGSLLDGWHIGLAASGEVVA